LSDFFERVRPLNEEMEALIRVGAFDEFGQNRTAQYWEFKSRSTPTKSEARRPKTERSPKPEGRRQNVRSPKSEIRNNGARHSCRFDCRNLSRSRACIEPG